MKNGTKKIHTYIHIGAHKTGTTAIQEYLRVNREKFISDGLYFPDSIVGIDYPSHYILNVYALDKNRRSTMKDKLLSTKKPEYFKKLKRNLTGDIARHYRKAVDLGCKEILWTNEGLYLLNSIREYKILYRLFAKHSTGITCVCCLRDKETYKKSYIRQLNKQGTNLSDEPDSYKYLQDDSWLFDYARKKDLLRSVFDEVIILDYDPQDMVKTFFDRLGYATTNTSQFRINVTRY